MSIRMGFAETDITPDGPVSLIGFYREDDTSKGVLKPLMAQAAVWKGEECCALIAIDSIGFTVELTNELRDKCADILKVSREKVMVCFSHTHAAPDAAAAEGYFETIREKIITAVKNAADNMETVNLHSGNGKADIGVNRRIGNNTVDDRIGILKVSDEKTRKDKLLLLRVTAHGNVLKRDNLLVSPDYFGDVRDTLKEKYGCPVMVIQGAAGNIAPKYFCSEETPVDATGPEFIISENALQLMADEICRSVEETELSDENNTDIYAYSREVILSSRLPSMERAKEIADEALKYCCIDGSEWLAEMERLHEQGVEVQKDTVEIQYLNLGAFRLCGVPYEIMTEFALAAEEGLQDEYFYLNGYTNGILSYFPTKEEYDLGGYEVYWSLLIYYKSFNRVYPFDREEADRLVRAVIQNA
ncbi:MAG: alkaline ceramidase [Lachnospiraceae bacterium]|nr:alkaline ceramidase [Lachnospiraceae bacterium]